MFQATRIYVMMYIRRLKEMTCVVWVSGYKAAFNAIDVDGDGRLSAKELRKMMSDIGEDITEDEARALIREADTDCECPIVLVPWYHGSIGVLVH